MGSSETATDIEARRVRKLKYEIEIDFTDRGRANMLHQIVGGTLRYVAERNQWLIWRDDRWQVDEHEEFVRSYALQVAYSYLEVARVERAKGNNETAEKYESEARRCRSTTALDRMIRELTLTLGVPISVNELDQNPWLLGVPNGVVDLRTGALRTIESMADYVTKRCSVAFDPDAPAPRWQRFVEEITGAPVADAADVNDYRPRPELARYLQKLLGYCCTGTTREHKMFIAVGAGANGKSVMLEAVERVLGSYAATLPADALMASRFGADAERPTALAAGLAGARFVVASEVRDGQKLDVGGIKNHTGDGKLTARRMRENPTTFDVTHKLVLLTNVRPALDHLDAAIRGRLHLIPYDRRWNRPGDVSHDPTLPDADKGLSETLKAESDGILAWLVRGAVMYQQEGLEPPAEVLELTHDYMRDQDHLQRWIEEACERCSARDGELAGDLYTAFKIWCHSDGVENPFQSANSFGTALSRKQVEAMRTKTGARRGLKCTRRSSGEVTADDLL